VAADGAAGDFSANPRSGRLARLASSAAGDRSLVGPSKGYRLLVPSAKNCAAERCRNAAAKFEDGEPA